MVEMITYDPEIFNETWNKISNVTEKRMKQYKLNTHLISGYRKDEEIPKEVRDDLISEGCPESWFSPIEKEFKKGDWIFVTKTITGKNYLLRIERITGDRYYGCGFEGSVWSDSINLFRNDYEYQKATKDEIETALIAEAKRRGLVKGTKINNSSVVGFEVKDKEIEDHRYLKYNKNSDSLSYVSDNSPKEYPIYEQGKWAEIVDEPIQINGYEVEIGDLFVKVGCTHADKSVFRNLSNYSTSYDLSIHREGEDITKQIKQIAERL